MQLIELITIKHIINSLHFISYPLATEGMNLTLRLIGEDRFLARILVQPVVGRVLNGDRENRCQ